MERISEVALTFLLNAAWQVALVALAAACGARLLRDASARYRHAVWVAALLLSVALPVWSLYNFSADANEAAAQATAATAAMQRGGDAHAATRAAVDNAAGGASESVFSAERLLQRRRRTLPSMPDVALVFVFAYAIFLLYRLYALGRAWRLTCEIRRTAYARALPEGLKEAASVCAQSLGVGDTRVLCSASVSAPVTTGWRAPLIILPGSFYEPLPAETLVSVLGHEMAHIARRDFPLNLAYEFLRLPLSFHPLANLVWRQINRTRELACDELVAGRVVAADAYARTLVRVASSLSNPAGHAHSLGMFDADILEERVMRLIDKRGRTSVRVGRVLMAASLSLLLTMALCASVFSLGFRSEAGASNQAQEVRASKSKRVDVTEKIGALSSGDASERAKAACALGRARAVEAIPALINLLGDDASIEPLKCWDEDADWSPALATFRQASPGEEAAIALAAMGQASVEPLVAALGHGNASVRRNAAWAIGEISGGMSIDRDTAVAPLRSALSDADEWVRAAAARALGEIRDERAVESLLAALTDGSAQVRETAAWSLGELKERSAVQSLGVMLLRDEASSARRMAAWALGEIQDPKAVASLSAALDDPEPRVREKAKWALSEIQE
ncbi:MAG TPA: M56 family metallopeptidase [Pyrinomonadaceae bacterium]|jgi:beta-lactamase regulating signal transducer with metallopeptidase domain